MLIKKIKDKGFFGTLGAILKRVGFKAPISRLSHYGDLRKNDFLVNFLHEGGINVKLPQASLLDILFGRGVITKRNIEYATRPSAEVLLRKTIFEMYESGFIDNELSIVDIGSWISDNSIVWAQYLSGGGIVFAIDPSSENLSYGRTLSELNQIENIKFVKAVCAEKSGIKLDFDGSIDHASFKSATSKRYIESSTIDEIVNEEGSRIGLLHVDVEGFELAVIRGSEEIIRRDMPVIIFEQHISRERTLDLFNHLRSFGYRIFMINEVLPGCELDCRNFLALPSEKGIPKLAQFDQSDGSSLGIFSAVIGEPIIEI